jgi:hypothetical protein
VRLPGIRNRANDKEIGKGGNFAKIEDPQVNSFLRFGSAGGSKPVGQFLNGGWSGKGGTACQKL